MPWGRASASSSAAPRPDRDLVRLLERVIADSGGLCEYEDALHLLLGRPADPRRRRHRPALDRGGLRRGPAPRRGGRASQDRRPRGSVRGRDVRAAASREPGGDPGRRCADRSRRWRPSCSRRRAGAGTSTGSVTYSRVRLTRSSPAPRGVMACQSLSPLKRTTRARIGLEAELDGLAPGDVPIELAHELGSTSARSAPPAR